MIKKSTKIIIDWLIRCEAIEELERELYEYAVYSILLTISPMILAIAYGILFSAVWRSVLIILPFMLIRKFSGGYHAKNAGVCFISSSLLLVLCINISFHIKCGWMLMSVVLVSALSLICNSPIENENRVLSREEQICYKRITIIITVIFVLINLLLLCLHMYNSAICISVGIALSACLQIPCILSHFVRKLK